MRNMLLIVNPRAGKGSAERNIPLITGMLSARGICTTVYCTQSRGDAQAAAEELSNRYDTVICSGGDGTLEEVVAGVISGGSTSRIGYVPAGSTNDFAYSLNIPTNPQDAVSAILDGEGFPCDVGKFNDRYFIYVAAFGAFTEVSYRTDQDLKNVLGHGAYILEGARSLFDLKPYWMKAEYGGKTVEGDFLFGMISNSKSVGGIRTMTPPEMDFDDGEFEITLIRNPVYASDWETLIGSLVSREADGTFLIYDHASRIVFKSEKPVAWTLDGEEGGVHESCEIQNLKQEIRLLLPKR